MQILGPGNSYFLRDFCTAEAIWLIRPFLWGLMGFPDPSAHCSSLWLVLAKLVAIVVLRVSVATYIVLVGSLIMFSSWMMLSKVHPQTLFHFILKVIPGTVSWSLVLPKRQLSVMSSHVQCCLDISQYSLPFCYSPLPNVFLSIKYSSCDQEHNKPCWEKKQKRKQGPDSSPAGGGRCEVLGGRLVYMCANLDMPSFLFFLLTLSTSKLDNIFFLPVEGDSPKRAS